MPRSDSRGCAWLIAARVLVAVAATSTLPAAAQSRARDTVSVVDTTRIGRRALAPVTVQARSARAVAPPVVTVDVAPAALTRASHQAASTYDLVRRVAGVEVHEQGQGPGFTGNVVVRGFTSDHSADVALSIDGVPINLPMHGHVEGYADWNLLLPLAISSMRLISGSASPLYGDFALGGAMEVFTSADAAGALAAIGVSSVGDVRAQGLAGRRGTTSGYAVAGQLDAQRGWRDNDASRLVLASARGWRAVGRSRLEAGLLAAGSGWNSPGFVPVVRYNALALRPAADPTDGGSGGRVIAHLRLSRPLGRAALEATVWGQGVRSQLYLQLPEPGVQLGQTRERDQRVLAGGQLQLGWPLLGGEATAGVTARADGGQYTLFDSEQRVVGEQTVGYEARYAASAVYARWRRVVGVRLGIDVGARVDALHYRADNVRDTLGWQTGTHVVPTPKVGVRYLLGGAWAVTAATSAGFRGALGVIGDPAREPFRSWAHEVGVQYSRAMIDGRLALFRTDVRNERIQDPVTRSISAAGRSRRQGIDGSVAVGLGHGALLARRADPDARDPLLRLAAGGTINDARLRDASMLSTDSSGGSAVVRLDRVPLRGEVVTPTERPRLHDGPHSPPLSGQRIPGVARATGRVEGDLQLSSRVRLSATWRFFGSFVPVSEPDVTTRASSVLDVDVAMPIRWRRGERATLGVAITNALDLRYVENRAAGFVTPGLPRMLRVGLQMGGTDARSAP